MTIILTIPTAWEILVVCFWVFIGYWVFIGALELLLRCVEVPHENKKPRGDTPGPFDWYALISSRMAGE